jgi:hypothetical protein
MLAAMARTADRWYHHVPAARAQIPCEGQEHTVTWRWGKFKLDDHDLGAERAMLVLGGEPAACLRALRLWGDQFGMAPEQFVQMRRWLGADAPLAPEEFEVPRQVGIALSWERSWKQSAYFDKHGKLIERQLRDLALPVVRAHLTAEKQRFGSRMVRRVELRMVAAGQPLGMHGQMDSVSVSATVSLSSDWVVHVWSRGMGVVEGAFVLEVLGVGRAAGSTSVRAVRWMPRDGHPGVAEPAMFTADVLGDAVSGWRLVEGEGR